MACFLLLRIEQKDLPSQENSNVTVVRQPSTRLRWKAGARAKRIVECHHPWERGCVSGLAGAVAGCRNSSGSPRPGPSSRAFAGSAASSASPGQGGGSVPAQRVVTRVFTAKLIAPVTIPKYTPVDTIPAPPDLAVVGECRAVSLAEFPVASREELRAEFPPLNFLLRRRLGMRLRC